MRVTANSARYSHRAGVSLVPLDQIKQDADSNTPSLSSKYGEKRDSSDQGPQDSKVQGIYLRLYTKN